MESHERRYVIHVTEHRLKMVLTAMDLFYDQSPRELKSPISCTIKGIREQFDRQKNCNRAMNKVLMAQNSLLKAVEELGGIVENEE